MNNWTEVKESPYAVLMDELRQAEIDCASRKALAHARFSQIIWAQHLGARWLETESDVLTNEHLRSYRVTQGPYWIRAYFKLNSSDSLPDVLLFLENEIKDFDPERVENVGDINYFRRDVQLTFDPNSSDHCRIEEVPDRVSYNTTKRQAVCL
jgi:hypothetical protein